MAWSWRGQGRNRTWSPHTLPEGLWLVPGGWAQVGPQSCHPQESCEEHRPPQLPLSTRPRVTRVVILRALLLSSPQFTEHHPQPLSPLGYLPVMVPSLQGVGA